ncbi:MAG: hypothetical protein RMJ82_07315 [Gemmatales bacterium]|nr:hypothetical protein [Gemmatales bacterium]
MSCQRRGMPRGSAPDAVFSCAGHCSVLSTRKDYVVHALVFQTSLACHEKSTASGYLLSLGSTLDITMNTWNDFAARVGLHAFRRKRIWFFASGGERERFNWGL